MKELNPTLNPLYSTSGNDLAYSELSQIKLPCIRTPYKNLAIQGPEKRFSYSANTSLYYVTVLVKRDHKSN